MNGEEKKNLFKGVGSAIIGIDDEQSARMANEVIAAGTRQVYRISVLQPVIGGVYVLNGALYDAMFGEAEKIDDLDIKTLPGLHNHQNAAAAYAAARMMGVPPHKIMHAMRSFPGLPHRQFASREINDIAYINDSKATNAAAAEKALACYSNIFWIVGGKPKEGGLEGLEPYMDRIAQAFTIGSAMEEFSAWLEKQNVAVSRCGTLERAVAEAHRAAQERGHGVVLLSPACASFDQFNSFEHRGDEFTRLVDALEEVAR